MNSIINVVTVVSSPFISASRLLRAGMFYLNPSAREREVSKFYTRLEVALGSKELPSHFKRSIQSFLVHHIPKEQLENIEYIYNNESEARAKGCLKCGCGIIGVSASIVDAGKNGLTSEHKFVILHEVGHLVNGDGHEGNCKREAVSNSLALLAYGISTFVLPSLSLWGGLSTHLIGCLGSTIVRCAVDFYIRRNQERRADRFAAKTEELIQGGISYFKSAQEENKTVRSDCLKTIKKEACKCRNLSSLFRDFYCVLASTPGGDFWTDCHPPLSERIHSLQQSAAR